MTHLMLAVLINHASASMDYLTHTKLVEIQETLKETNSMLRQILSIMQPKERPTLPEALTSPVNVQIDATTRKQYLEAQCTGSKRKMRCQIVPSQGLLCE